MHYPVLTLSIIISAVVRLRILFVYRLSSLKNYPLFIRVMLPGFFRQWAGHQCETNLQVFRFINKNPTVFFMGNNFHFLITFSYYRCVTLVLFTRVFLLHTSTMLVNSYW